MWLVFSSAALFEWIASHESTVPPDGWKAACDALPATPARLKPTTSAPPPPRKLRRENSFLDVLAIPPPTTETLRAGCAAAAPREGRSLARTALSLREPLARRNSHIGRFL